MDAGGGPTTATLSPWPRGVFAVQGGAAQRCINVFLQTCWERLRRLRFCLSYWRRSEHARTSAGQLREKHHPTLVRVFPLVDSNTFVQADEGCVRESPGEQPLRQRAREKMSKSHPLCPPPVGRRPPTAAPSAPWRPCPSRGTPPPPPLRAGSQRTAPGGQRSPPARPPPCPPQPPPAARARRPPRRRRRP